VDPVSEQPPTTGSPEAPSPFVADGLVVELESTIVAEPEQLTVASVASEPATGAPSPPVPANDATPDPLVKPIVIGGEDDAPVAEKKRGWWRR
jgi:hypothetical protein